MMVVRHVSADCYSTIESASSSTEKPQSVNTGTNFILVN